MNSHNDSFGIYDRGHGGYKETISFWRRQREGIIQRLIRFWKEPI